MSNSLGIGVVIGASLSAAYHKTFENANQKAVKLGQAYEEASKKLASAKAVNHYKSQLEMLKAKQSSLGTSSDRLNRGIADLEARYRKAKQEARAYGLSIGDIVKEQQRLQQSTNRLALKNLAAQQREAGRQRRVELHGQMLGAVGTAWAMSQPIKQAIAFESVMADVKKVVNFDEPEQFKAMGEDVLSLSTRIPIAASGLGDIVAAAGRAGIARNELLRFAEDAAKMGVAFDMSGAEAGAAMTGLRSIFRLAQDDVIKLGDAFNYLDNNMDTTASDLVQIANRAGSTADLFGLTGQQLGALGATFKAMKTPTEVAGTAINAMLMKLATADKQGDKFSDALANVGLSAEGLKADIEQDAQGALLSFFEAVKGSDDVMGTLSDLFGMEYSDDVSKIVNGLDQYKSALALVGNEAAYTGAMQKEYEERASTTAFQMQTLSNQATRLGVTLGSALLPPINMLAQNLGKAVDGITRFSEENPELMKTVVGVTAGLIGLKIAMIGGSFVASIFAGSLTTFKLVMLTAGHAMKAVTIAQWAWNAALMANPIGLIVTGIAAVVGGAYLLYKNWDTVTEWFNGALGKIGDAFSWIGDTWNNLFGDEDEKHIKVKPVIEPAKPLAKPILKAAVVGTSLAVTPMSSSQASLPQDVLEPPGHTANIQQAGNNTYHITINTTGNSAGGDEQAIARQIAQIVRREIEQLEQEKAARNRGALHD